METNIKPNLLKPRWSKVFSDLWGDKTRTILVVASITVGVFAVGMIITAFNILKADINLTYASANPANIEIWTDPFHEDFVRVIEKVPGVEEVEGRRIIKIRARKGAETWQGLTLVGVNNLEHSPINQLGVKTGHRVPGNDEVVISEDMVNYTGFTVGDEIEIELPDGSIHHLTVVGLVTDQTTTRPDPSSSSNAFVNLNTIRSLGLGSSLNRLLVTVEGPGSDEAFIAQILDQIEERIERNQRNVYRTADGRSDEHPMSDSLLAIMGVLGALGGLIMILSSSLIVNTLNALLTQQLRQIGVMKLVGGRSFQILGMYLLLITIYGLIALFIAVPLGSLAGYGLSSFMANLMGAQLQGFRVIPAAVAVQSILAFLIPLGSGFFPVNKGARTNVRRAISDYRPGNQTTNQSFLARSNRWIRWVSRPILMSIRNTFRKKGRLVLTIFTLTVAGAVFVAVFNVRSSMNHLMDQLMQHFMGDVTINFTQPYNVSKVERDLGGLPGVNGVEGWGGARGDIVDANDEAVTGLTVVAPPHGTQLLDPDMVAGRWLYSGEQKAMVLSDTIYSTYPDLQIGDSLRVEITGNRVEEWEVVGIYRYVEMFGDPMAYANFDYVADMVNTPNQATSFRLIATVNSRAELLALNQYIDQYLADKGYTVQNVELGEIMRENASIGMNMLVIFLLIMAILTAFVGSIGLTGTMSINVLERTREIGVMRTIGAVDFVIMQSVIIEGLVIGLITWILAIGLSFPISKALLQIIGETMAGSTFALHFTPLGISIWLGVIIGLSIIASIMPARNAARLTINEVLAYE
jgi:putative ABC transport system permease protein